MKPTLLARYLDYANHKPTATHADIRKLCKDVLKYGFNSAFVNQNHVSYARKLLGRKAKVGTIISFPLGEDLLDAKLVAVKDSLKAGADELDTVPNIELFKEKRYKEFLKEMKTIVKAAKKWKKNCIVKFIVETGYLNNKEIAKFADLIVRSGADFVKICSGMGPRSPTVKDIQIVNRVVNGRCRIKAAGGISTFSKAISFIKAGANRLGTSHAVKIIKGAKGGSGRGE